MSLESMYARAKKFNLKLNAYEIIRSAVCSGVKLGMSRSHQAAWKRGDVAPSEEEIMESIEGEVMNALSWIIDFDSSAPEIGEDSEPSLPAPETAPPWEPPPESSDLFEVGAPDSGLRIGEEALLEE